MEWTAGRSGLSGLWCFWCFDDGRPVWEKRDNVEIDVILWNVIWWHKCIMSKYNAVLSISLYRCFDSTSAFTWILLGRKLRTNQANQPTKTILFCYILCFDDMMLDVLAHGIHGVDPSTELSWVLEFYVVYLRKSHRWTDLWCFSGRQEFVPTDTIPCIVIKFWKNHGWPNWQLAFMMIFVDLLDISCLIFYLLHINMPYQQQKTMWSLALSCELLCTLTLIYSWPHPKNVTCLRRGFNSSCRSWWICLLQLFSSWSSITWPGAEPFTTEYHGFCWRKLQRRKYHGFCWRIPRNTTDFVFFGNVWISIFFLFL